MNTYTKEGIRISTDSGDTDASKDADWYTIKGNPVRCSGCGGIWKYPHCEGRIIVWPEKDDPNILEFAAGMRDNGYNPKILAYENSMGPCISYYLVND